MASTNENISIRLIEDMWVLMTALVEQKSASADTSIDAAIGRADAVSAAFDPTAGQRALDAVETMVLPTKPTMDDAPTMGVAPTAPQRPPTPTLAEFNIDPLGAINPMADFGAPPVFDSSADLSMEGLRNLYDGERLGLMLEMKTSFEEFIDRFFPVGGYFEKATSWLERALDAQGTGIPLHVEAAIWERDRARLYRESAAAEDEAMTTWAGRGYPMPPGALNHSVNTIRQGLTNQLAQQSRDIAIKVTDIHIENAKFAVTNAAQIRQQAIQSAVEYIKALMVSPSNAGQWISALIDGRSKLIGAEADVYKTRAGVASDVYKTGANVALEKYKTSADVTLEAGKTQNQTGLEVYRTTADVNRQQFMAQLETYRLTEEHQLQLFKVAQENMVRFFEAEVRSAQVKAELLTRAGELSARLSEADAKIEIDKAQLTVQAAIEKARQIATQAAAALNNMQLNAGISNVSSTSARV